MLPKSIQAALTLPAISRTGTIADVQHVVIFMQENRSFYHYFGTLRGVRGFHDRRTITLPNGNPVWKQPACKKVPETMPFHLDTKTTRAQFLGDLPHGWSDQHQAWNGGAHDQWLAAKGAMTMGFHKREDVPYHYALADAFTICDQYFCSLLGPTDPNRLYHWTGAIVDGGTHKGSPIANSGDNFSWTTYPERLEAAGISWRIYQQSLSKDPENGNFEDNTLAYFLNFKQAVAGTPLYANAMTPRTLDEFAQDALNDRLPQVSWMVAPERYSEHPSAPPGFGAYYTSLILDALTANPEVWGKTAFIINFDENDGFFDHVPPFTPPRSEKEGRVTMDVSADLYGKSKVPFGLGVRVPMLIISPWTRGGYVCSQVFDHTSTLQFLETRFGVREPNISPWRRAVCGDLTSAFNFAKSDASVARLPSTVDYKAMALKEKSLPRPTVPAEQNMPQQEPGTRPARALPYEFHVNAAVARDGGFSIQFASTGLTGGAFNVYSRLGTPKPWKYAVDAGAKISDDWNALAQWQGAYDLEVFGANGFYRRFAGNVRDAMGSGKPNPEISLRYDRAAGNIGVVISNHGDQPSTVIISDRLYKNEPDRRHVVAPGQTIEDYRLLQASSQWYEITAEVEGQTGYLRQFAGHLETGRESITDPAMAQPAAA